jgi:hypothetical protein
MDASEELNQSATGTGQRRLHACPFLQDSAETHERATANCLLIFRAEQIERDVRHEVDKGGEGVRKGRSQSQHFGDELGAFCPDAVCHVIFQCVQQRSPAFSLFHFFLLV